MKKELNLEEIHNVTLEVLESFHNLCEELNVTYYLAYGTLLGAIRHKDFIPWDDDADVWMPRADYDKLTKYCDDHKDKIGPYKLANRLNTKNYIFGISRYSNMNYEYIPIDGSKPIEIGVFIDIYPLDPCTNCYDDASKIFNKIRKENKKFEIYVNPKSLNIYKTIIKFPCHCILNIVYGKDYISKFDERILEYINKNTSNDDIYLGVPVWPDTDMPKIYKREWFEGRKLIDFHNKKFYIPKGWQNLLETEYGDYMKLPPENKRIPYHGYIIFKR